MLQQCTLSSGNIVGKCLDYMRTQGIKVPSVMHKLPSFYWLPKLHKNPCGNRFIAASNACTTQPLSGLLAACLTTLSGLL